MQPAEPRTIQAYDRPAITSQRNDPTRPTGNGLALLREILSEQTGLDIDDIYDSEYEE